MDNNRRCVLLMRIPFNNEKNESATDNFFSQVVEILKGKKYLISAEIAIYNKYIWFSPALQLLKTQSKANGMHNILKQRLKKLAIILQSY